MTEKKLIQKNGDGAEYTLRMATPDDAKALVSIYEYYVKETAITFEYEVPTVDEFRGRIENTLKKFPYLVIERYDQSKASESPADACKPEILGYAYASSFHPREAYKWCAEMSVYLKKDIRRAGLGKLLYEELERRLKEMGILNLNACIGFPDEEDEHLTFGSVRFHEKMGYSMVGEFHKCGYKFGRWYNMVWMEKHIGEHVDNPKSPQFGSE